MTTVPDTEAARCGRINSIISVAGSFVEPAIYLHLDSTRPEAESLTGGEHGKMREYAARLFPHPLKQEQATQELDLAADHARAQWLNGPRCRSSIDGAEPEGMDIS